MKNNPQRVTIEIDPKCWYDSKTHVMRHYYCLRNDADGELFWNTQDKPRQWKRKGGATQFLKGAVKKFPSLRYIVTDEETGKESRIGDFSEPLSLDDYGPHDWHKVNLVTVEGPDGYYDLWRCELCRKEFKRYGLSGRPMGDLCPKNRL